MITIVFETHSISEDNERRISSGWGGGPLSDRGRALARELGDRRRDDGIGAVFSSDLLRARETVDIAFAGQPMRVLLDWRLRECDYGELNGAPADQHVRDRIRYVDHPYPGGESWSEAVARVVRLLGDLSPRWDESRVLIVGHVATRWALDHYLAGIDLRTLANRDFAWQPGWEYRFDPAVSIASEATPAPTRRDAPQ
jgi:2,3-bisphosphoglycerate-dependent phosphoglycerate mutase